MVGRLIYYVAIEVLGKANNLIGALIRWTYLRKQHSFKEVSKMEGNVAVGLFVTIPVLAILVLVFLKK
jgi:hypothetical protein